MAASEVRVPPEAASVTVPVVREGPLGEAVAVLTRTGGSIPTTSLPSTVSVRFPAGVQIVSVPMSVQGPLTTGGAASATYTLTGPVGSSVSNGVVNVVTDLPPPPGGPVFNLELLNPDRFEGESATILVTRDGDRSQPATLTFNYGGTATSGLDYFPSNTIVLPPGHGVFPLVLPLRSDLLVEPDESLVVTLAATTRGIIGPQSTVTVTLRDRTGTGGIGFAPPTFTITTATAGASAVVGAAPFEDCPSCTVTTIAVSNLTAATFDPTGRVWTVVLTPGATGQVAQLEYEIAPPLGAPAIRGLQAIGVPLAAPGLNPACVARPDGPFLLLTPGTEALPVLRNDFDPEGLPLFIKDLKGGGKVTLSIAPDGKSVLCTPVPGAEGEDWFEYRCTDGVDASEYARVTVIIVPPGPGNRAPIALPDERRLCDVRSLINPVANDFDPDGDPLALLAIPTPPTRGTAVIVGPNLIRYTLLPGGVPGPDQFTYEISDGQGHTTLGLVRLTINRPPEAVTDEVVAQVNETILIKPLANDTDPDADPLALVKFDQGRAGGLVKLAAPDQLFYTPPPGYFGQDRFAYEVSDGCRSVRGMVVVGVNRPPLAGTDFADLTPNQVVAIVLLANDRDPDNDPLRVERLGAPRHGNVVQPAPGVALYTPPRDYLGRDQFDYEISDGRGGRATATAHLSIQPRNRPPLARPDFVAVPAGATVLVEPLRNDADPDGDALGLTRVAAPAHGTILASNAVAFTYRAPTNLNGVVKVDYQVTDARGLSALGTVWLTVSLPEPLLPYAPVAVSDAASTEAEFNVLVPVLDNDFHPALFDFSLASFTPGGFGGVQLGANPGSLDYAPVPGYVGPDWLTYTITDTNGLLSAAPVLVSTLYPNPPDNEPPLAVPDTYELSGAAARILPVTANDTDPNGDALIVASWTAPARGRVQVAGPGELLYQPVSGSYGTDTFNYTVADGRGGASVGVVTVILPPSLVFEIVAAGGAQQLRLTIPPLEGNWILESTAQLGSGAVWQYEATAPAPGQPPLVFTANINPATPGRFYRMRQL